MSFTAYDALAFAGSRAIDVLVFAMSNIIMALGYFFVNYPQASTLAISLVAIYITYKMFRRILRFFVNVVLTMIKLTTVSLVLLMLLAVYVRGFERFFTKDIYFIKELLFSKVEASDQAFKQYAYKIMNDDGSDYLHGVKDFFERSSFHIDESYINQFAGSPDSIRESLNRGFESVQGAFGEEGLRNLNNFLNNLNH
ncbi:hypothetical protein CJJ07_000242 [Candidozyma auris]|uniref:hypothetical_protein n=1 Tax=Candidozyma auris TaxID=498019 RepID=UPI000D28DC2E|nr:hypothetical_protein [[Candida] auris]PSK79880.1 hypothetical protein CJJ07_000242 [[Candida] auris]QEL62021.1 hypothetical protein CJJ09_004186 [[Candida] auris]QEO23067.1 hypothetical_protein [[Candida] auris]QRG39530.1 hypothetical protein FDK38_003975 [[Candida] auris]GBL49114.1 hypothetical protein CAJCM15448_13880 [[Candida] auris]